MKNLAILSFLLIMGLGVITISCDREDDPQAPELSIDVTPVLVDAEPGETIDYTIILSGDLSSLSVDGNEIKNYSAQTFNDTILYSYTFSENASEDTEITFTVTDNSGMTDDFPVMIGFIQPDYMLADFSNKLADTAAWSDWWEGLNLASYPGATYAGGDASEAMYVTCRGSYSDPEIWNFDAALPEDEGTGLMITRASIENDDGTTAWDGYMIPVFGYYGEGMSQPDEAQLNQVQVGTRVLAVDVYYETDPASPASFDDISQATGGNGVKFQFRLGNHAKFVESEDKKGWFMAKEAFVTAPNEWVTLYFNQDDEGELSNIEGNDGLDAIAAEVDFVWFIPAYGYDTYDTHKVYVKNFRITNLPTE
ncbi:MAG: hypothetical protein ACOCUP_00555 [bacterium]